MFYDIFKKLCDQRGIKPGPAAEACGINRSNVSLWKSKGYTPRGDALQSIADYFGVSADYLLGKEEQKEKSPSARGERGLDFDAFTYAMCEEGKELTEENKAKLLEMAKFFRQQQEKEKP